MTRDKEVAQGEGGGGCPVSGPGAVVRVSAGRMGSAPGGAGWWTKARRAGAVTLGAGLHIQLHAVLCFKSVAQYS